MPFPQEHHLTGADYLQAVTTLQQRIRNADPTFGAYEAADHQWWWRSPRLTDDLPQLFWFDGSDAPVAAAVTIDWKDRVALVPIVMPGASPIWVQQVVERGLDQLSRPEFETKDIEIEVDEIDKTRLDLLTSHGFANHEDGLVETWMTASSRPDVSPLRNDYRLATRADSIHLPHHMTNRKRNHEDIEPRLQQTSLYRPDLDLVIYDQRDNVAAYGLFWYDPVTAAGLVEPMRTEDEHQRRGLARHILTAGVDLLAKAGAQRIKICFESANPASKNLYLSVGFEPTKRTVLCSRAPTQRVGQKRTPGQAQ